MRREGFGQEVSAVRNRLLILRSGVPRAVVATSSLNFDGLAPEQQATAVQAFRDLLNAQSGPFQLYLRIRRVGAGNSAEPDASAYPDRRQYLAALTRSFINAHLEETPVYQRELFIVLAPVEGGRPLLRSWRFHFERRSEAPVTVALHDTDSIGGRRVLAAVIFGDGDLPAPLHRAPRELELPVRRKALARFGGSPTSRRRARTR